MPLEIEPAHGAGWTAPGRRSAQPLRWAARLPLATVTVSSLLYGLGRRHPTAPRPRQPARRKRCPSHRPCRGPALRGAGVWGGPVVLLPPERSGHRASPTHSISARAAADPSLAGPSALSVPHVTTGRHPSPCMPVWGPDKRSHDHGHPDSEVHRRTSRPGPAPGPAVKIPPGT